MNGTTRGRSVTSQGIYTGPLKPGDDVMSIIIKRACEQTGGFQDGDILGITEAVVAYGQKNFCSFKDVGNDVEAKFGGANELVLVDPIQSRNRFMPILRGVLKAPSLTKVYIIMTYPSDEVGNAFFAEEVPDDVNPNWDVFGVGEFYEKFGVPCHPFTGKNYIEEYLKICKEAGVEGEILLCNNFKRIPDFTACNNFLVCNIHNRNRIRNRLSNLNPNNKVLTLADIMNAPVCGSGFNDRFGLYGSNCMDDEKIKLMPINCQAFVEEVQSKIKAEFGVHVEVMIFGDGAFKDPRGGIWELADPVVSPGFTSGLQGTPKEVKAKLLISGNSNLPKEEVEALIESERVQRLEHGDIKSQNSLGTTPRQLSDLVGSLCDLTTGSGDRMTPAVVVRGYLA